MGEHFDSKYIEKLIKAFDKLSFIRVHPKRKRGGKKH